MSLAEKLRVSGPVHLAEIDPRSTPGVGDRDEAEAGLAAVGEGLADLQERLFAQGRTGGTRRLLLVLQGMDTSGKGGVVKHVAGLMNPAGLRIAGFGKPTEEERTHDFLWRIEKALPPPGLVGVFDRSHYEDVLVVRVNDLVPQAEWEPRYERINEWEAGLVAKGLVIVKVMLHISADEQKKRLLARLDDPTKLWKVNPGDLTERAKWADYQQAYEVALARCSTEVAPWHVIPADRKWYRNWAIGTLLHESFQAMDLQWPTPELDLEGMRRELEAG